MSGRALKRGTAAVALGVLLLAAAGLGGGTPDSDGTARPNLATGRGGSCKLGKPVLEVGAHLLDQPKKRRQRRSRLAGLTRSSPIRVPTAATATGDLDSGFDGDGRVTTNVSAGPDEGWDVAVQPDGRIVVVGHVRAGGGYDVFVARFNPDGSRDATFGENGAAFTDLGSSEDRAYAVAIQPDGKIVVAGATGAEGSRNFALARYLPDGSLDLAFGASGKVVISMAPGDDKAHDVAVQSDGRILAAGYAYARRYRGRIRANFALIALRPDGSPDTSFGVSGRVTTDFAGGDDVAQGLALQPDGRILAGGYTILASGSAVHAAVARYHPNGALDTSFGGDGRVTTQVGLPIGCPATITAFEALAVQPDGKIVATGWATDYIGFFAWFSTVRYNSRGALDRNFGRGGTVLTSPSDQLADFASDVVLQPNGTIVVAGVGLRGSSIEYDFALVRYRANGKPDPLFASHGKTLTSVGLADDFAWGVALDPNGSIVSAGSAGGQSSADVALTRHRTSGVLDSSFGSGGVVKTNFGSGVDAGYDIAVQPDGKLLVAGTTRPGLSPIIRFALTRYDSQGAPDTSFGSGGLAGGFAAGQAYAIALQSDGKIILAGGFATATTEIPWAVRYTSSGTTDEVFNAISFGSATAARALDVAVLPDGRVLAAGFVRAGGSASVALVRWLPDGTRDNAFGTFGRITKSLSPADDEGHGLVVLEDGSFLVAGFAERDGQQQFALARFRPDATLDESFGEGGVVLTPVGSGDAQANALAVQGDGKTVLAGFAAGLGGTDFALARYLPDGTLDSGFGQGGIAIVPITSGDDRAEDVALDAEGFILVAGTAASGAGDFALARLRPNGTVDSTFGQGGKVTTDFAGGPDRGAALAVQPGGAVDVAGTAFRPGTGDDFALARYLP